MAPEAKRWALKWLVLTMLAWLKSSLLLAQLYVRIALSGKCLKAICDNLMGAVLKVWTCLQAECLARLFPKQVSNSVPTTSGICFRKQFVWLTNAVPGLLCWKMSADFWTPSSMITGQRSNDN
ncbi:hypothetical protein TSA66_11275 [Noviherbaspirillum autotrophicum]|uniref:Uncharacterized protein n=1 Tax=Noviherbaspirillum autotrophicum TaxID=709839 RepID=A0A0C2BMN8_9BURK|nr:hypothetical protein TSA66_11275 [Noviherbaspirillum autotrophicum]